MIKDILYTKRNINVTIKAWVVSNRGNNNIRFLSVNDGSTFANLQVVLKDDLAIKFDKVHVGAAVDIHGKIMLTPTNKQPLELVATDAIVLGNTTTDYPLQKHGISKEVLREIPHLRHRTNLFKAVMRIRSTLYQEINSFFYERNFLQMAAPIITGNDGEGAGEAFVVDSEQGDFFGKKATLGVTGQLHAESYANGFGKVYTFAPTFRAENSHTQKHAAEFWMIEPEIAFEDKKYAIKLADSLLKEVIKKVMKIHRFEFDFLEKFVDNSLKNKLNNFLQEGIHIITYKDAIAKLQQEQVKKNFVEKNIYFGMDLNTEHEKYIAEVMFKGAVAVVDYPQDIKAFYMKQNSDGETVAAFDILVPGIGELVGGSERECDYHKLMKRIKDMNIDNEDIQWYLDLRKFGHVQSVGFGIGFERLVMFVTGIENIRDTLPYPRTPKNMKM